MNDIEVLPISSLLTAAHLCEGIFGDECPFVLSFLLALRIGALPHYFQL